MCLRFEISCRRFANPAKDALVRRPVSSSAICPIHSPENASPKPEETRGIVRVRHRGCQDNSFPGIARRRIGSGLRHPPSCARGDGSRRKAGTSTFGTTPPARARIPAWRACPLRAQPSNASWRRCQAASSRMNCWRSLPKHKFSRIEFEFVSISSGVCYRRIASRYCCSSISNFERCSKSCSVSFDVEMGALGNDLDRSMRIYRHSRVSIP